MDNNNATGDSARESFANGNAAGPSHAPNDRRHEVIDAELVAIDGDIVDPDSHPDDDAPDTVDHPDQRGPESSLVARLRASSRRRVLPSWARSWVEFASTLTWLCRFWLSVGAYHALRLPKYAALLAARAPRGIARTAVSLVRWTWDLEGLPARLAAVRRDDVEQYLRLSRQRDQRVRARLLVMVPALLLTIAGR